MSTFDENEVLKDLVFKPAPPGPYTYLSAPFPSLRPLFRKGDIHMNIDSIFNNHAEWSQKQFGDDSVHGPEGPAERLVEEAGELQANPADIMEQADCLLLLFDIARRSGYSLTMLLMAAQLKLEVNKTRKWDNPPSSKVKHKK